jgi:hypothetical protein
MGMGMDFHGGGGELLYLDILVPALVELFASFEHLRTYGWGSCELAK